LKSARADPPDVVVIDYRLPDSDGATLAAELRREHPVAHLVMLTGLQDEATIREAVAAGCSGFVTKDRAVDELVESVRTVQAGGSVAGIERVKEKTLPPPERGSTQIRPPWRSTMR